MERLSDFVADIVNDLHENSDWYGDYSLIEAAIPAAEVAEVRHGRWEWKEEWETHPETHSCDLISCGWYCSNCGIELGEYLTEKTGRYVCLDDDYCEPTLRRCPNCGARMDKEDEHGTD
jgi:hypothetical protein